MSVTDRFVAGIDWAKDNHAVCVIDAAGEPVARLTVAHTKAGIGQVVEILSRYAVAGGLAGVGIERPDGPLVAALLAAGLDLFVVPPAQVKGLRSRYGSAGNKDDRFDAYVLADTVRTDRRRRAPLRPDSAATSTLRALVRARSDLVVHRVAVANQLQAHLHTVLPAAAELFCELTSPISRAFLAVFPTQDAVDALTLEQLRTWLAGQRYRQRKPEVILQRLREAPAGITGPAGQALAGITAAYLAALSSLLSSLVEQIDALQTQIADALAAHPDAKIFTSLPGPAPCAPPGCWLRSATAAAATPPPRPWPGWPG